MPSQGSIIKTLAKTPNHQINDVLRRASPNDWTKIKELCTASASGELVGGRLPRASKRWFNGVVNDRHGGPKQLRRSVIQRGGNEAIMTTIKLLAQAAKAAAVPAVKKVGTALAKKAAASAIEKAGEKAGELVTKKLTTSAPIKDTTDLSNLSVDQLLEKYK